MVNSKNYSANAKIVKNFTQSTETTLPQIVRNHSEFLPAINQTESITRFFKATVDQLLSSGSTESLNSIWGRISGRSYNAESDLFQIETDANRANYQFAPGIVYRNVNKVESTVSYINSLRRFENLGSDTTNHDKLFSELGYTLDLPINIDMFINHTNYYWLENDIPVVEITPTAANPINIDDIVVRSAYTTPVLANSKTLQLVNGLRIKFIGVHATSTSTLYAANAIYYVEGVGSKHIRLVEQYDTAGINTFPITSPYSISYPSGWDLLAWDTANWDFRGYVNTGSATVLNKSYIVMDRGCADKNPWARSNRWFSIYALRAMAAYNNIVLDPYLNRITTAKYPIIEFQPDMELFNSGRNLIAQPTYYVSGLNSSGITGQVTYQIDTNNFLANGDTILFIADQFGRSDGIYTVGGVGSAITLTASILPGTLIDYDKVIIANGNSSGMEYHWFNATWVKSQQKTTRGTEVLFELYEDNISNYPALYGITTSDGNFVVNRAGGFPIADNHISTLQNNIGLKKLSDVADTDFAGERIFGYKTSTAANYDAELDLHPTFSDAVLNDIEFSYSLNNIRYSNKLSSYGSKQEIKGLYNYFNYVSSDYFNCWSRIRSDQRVPIIQTHIADGISTITFDLGTNAVNHPTEYSVTFDNGKYRFFEHSYIDMHDIGYKDPDLIFKRDTDYTINNLIWDSANNIQFVDPYGNVDASISVTTVGNIITLNIASTYAYEKVLYRSIGPSNNVGEIVVSDLNHARYVIKQNGQLITAGIDYTVTVGTTTVLTVTALHANNDVFELIYVADADLANAVYDVAPLHFYNATNKPYYGGSFSSLLLHFDKQLVALQGFSGDVTGENNYHAARRLHTADGLIRQQVFETPKLNYLLDNDAINPIKSIKLVSNDYMAFKSFFRNKVKQLWATSSFTSVRALVDRALAEINTGKNQTFKYALSDMAYYASGETEVRSITNATVFTLPHTVNQYGNSMNHVNVWLDEYNGTNAYYTRQLTVGIDYLIAGDMLTLLSPATLSGGAPATLTIRWFDYNQPNSYIPFSAAKLGFVKPTQVEILNGVLIGHDGSTYIANNTEFYDITSGNFDVVTAALLEFELRVFNNMVHDHTIGFDMAELYPSPHGKFGYNVNDINVRLDDWFNRYAIKNNITTLNTVQYSQLDKFTWNYSTVGAKLGSWRALYQYYFGTDRPHTHPWEMLNHRTKPTWWDSQYSWVTGVKRTALVKALQTGLISDPSLTTNIIFTNIKYARNKYDWNTNILVTALGVLNDPVTANVVTAPANVDAAKDFVFGDWSEVENTWRNTSEYRFALAEVFLQLKPYRTHELFWSVGRWNINNAISQSQWLDVSTNTRNTRGELHKQRIENGIISKAEVISGGAGYSNDTSITFPTSNVKIDNATADVRVTAGVITSVEITNPGRGYVSIPDNTVLTASTGAGAVIRYTIDFDYFPTHLGFSALAAEEYTLQETDSTQLATRLRDIDVEFMVHVGGFTDDRIITLELDGSYANGKIKIPESNFNILLDKNAPIKTVFFSGVKIEKVADGFKVSGYNLDSRYFVYNPVSNGGATVNENINGTTVLRHMNFNNETVRIPYDIVLRKKQELYDFLTGLGNYYASLGIIADAWDTDAIGALHWSMSTAVTPFYLNGVTEVLRYEHGTQGVSQEVDVNYNGTVNILDNKFSEIKKADLHVLRDTTGTNYSLKDLSNRIYGIGINTIEYEHMITIKNVTDFNDIVFDPAAGIAQTQINLIGERTRNWSGKVEAPGYLVKTSSIMLNIESGVREVENDWIDVETKALERLTRQTLGYNVGYTKPTYMKNTFIGDLSAFRFEKGRRKYQGTDYAIDAITKNKNIFGVEFGHKLSEEWMVRLGDYGDISKREPVQFIVNKNLIKSDSQLFRFSPTYVSDIDSDMVIDLHKNGPYSVSGDFAAPFDKYNLLRLDNTSIATADLYQDFIRDAGLPLTTEVDYFVKSVNDINDVYDPTAPYAVINNWNNAMSYVRGETIRQNGKVYQLNIDNTGLTTTYNNIVLRGTQVYPEVQSNETLVINGNTVTFAKTLTSTTTAIIELLGTVASPIIPSGTTLTIDGINVNFIKTSTSTTLYNNIVVDGTVNNPTIVNAASKSITIDGNPVMFNQALTTETLQQVYADAFTSVAGFTGVVNTIADARIVAFENLRAAYVAATSIALWQTWIGNYYVDTANVLYQAAGINPEYLGAQIAANPGATWETHARAMLANDLDLMNRVTGNVAETVQNVISNTFVNQVQYNTDITTTKTVLGYDPNIADAGTYMAANGGTSLTSTLLLTVATPTPIRYVTNSLIEIKDKINAAAILGITASISGTILRLTSTNAQMTVSASSTNTDVGLPAAITVYNATSTTTTIGQDLTLSEAVVAINNVSIPGITAFAVTNQLQIQSTNTTLILGASTGLTEFGLTAGTTNAVATITATQGVVEIYGIVDQINSANIPDVTASIIDGILILTSVGPTLIIGAGTANVKLGVTATTLNAVDTFVENIFTPADWTEIAEPANFNIWVIDDIGINAKLKNTTNFYNVYQTTDNHLGVIEICAGNMSGQDAEITCNADHGLNVDDFVLIVNSTCIPNINGIHRVTRLTGTTIFFIDKYIKVKGQTGTVIPVRTMRFSDTNAATTAINTLAYVNGNYGLALGAHVYVDTVLGEFNNSLGYGGVYVLTKEANVRTLKLLRTEEAKTDNSKIVNGILYNYNTNTRIKKYEVFDPLKGILPGIADKELDIKHESDFASYNNSTDSSMNLELDNAWGMHQVGTTWWDLSNAIYLNYDQGSDEYKQENWGKLFPTSTIDVYEWTKSPVTPDEYKSSLKSVIDGIELTGEPYNYTDAYGDVHYYWSEGIELDNNTNQLNTYYYFWVKNKTTVPSLDREYSIFQLSEIIRNPALHSLPWVAATGSNTLLVNGLLQIDGYDNMVMQINMNKHDTEYHQEFILLGENDPLTVIPEWLHISLRDSLAGFTQQTNTVDYTVWNGVSIYVYNDVVQGSNGSFYICHTGVTGVDPVTDTINNNWRILIASKVNPDGEVSIPESANVEYIASRHIPSSKLHPYVTYGIGTRPHQTWFMNLVNARKVAIDKINSQLLRINLVDSNIAWKAEFSRSYTVGAKTYDLSKYWVYVDWNLDTNNINDGSQADYFVNNVSDLAALMAPLNNEVAQVTFSTDADGINRRSAWKYVNNAWLLIFKEKCTIAFNNLVWDSTLAESGWDIALYDSVEWDGDAGSHIFEIFNSFYNVIFSNNMSGLYADLWFHLVKHVMHEQPNVDWIFKSSYISLVFDDALEKKYNKYFKQNINELFDYVNEVKPFRSKLRDATLQKTAADNTSLTLNSIAELRVQTNPINATLDPIATRSFKIAVNENGVHYASQIVNNNKTLLGLDVLSTDTVIPTIYSGQLPVATNGVIWMNGERITYAAKLGQLLVGCVRGTGNTIAKAHTALSVIEDASGTLDLLMPTYISTYGNNIMAAFNQSGKSLLNPTNIDTTSITIRANGLGEIDVSDLVSFYNSLTILAAYTSNNLASVQLVLSIALEVYLATV